VIEAKLRPRTIIPAHLYVERPADSQIIQIIEEMGRPGYVLVARQMGKTNLLLNAKRKYEGADCSFCYFDASNSQPDLRSFFRALIDVCIDGYPDRFSVAAQKILDARRATSLLLPHKEHEVELRYLLGGFSGKIVICIDEIDAITRTAYSDRVFSHIRSTYFSGRTNFPEFERLTYVLSGVAEPSEIIRDRSISPFNIGEKIYLEDFTCEQTQELIDKSGVKFSASVVNEIYEWASGNPRMTWDISSEVERHLLAGDVVDVRAIVEKLYLDRFDRPPVDHMRIIAQTDRDVREGLMSIHYGKGASVSDLVRSKLYLSGICGSLRNSSLRIKNKIIELALSEAWLLEVEKGSNSLRDYAIDLFRQRKFREAAQAFVEFEGGSVGPDEQLLLDFYLGSCLYFLDDYDAAALRLEKASAISRVNQRDLYLTGRSRLGSSLLRAGRADEAMVVLEELLGETSSECPEKRSQWYFQASINLSSALMNMKPPQLSRASQICESVISQLSGSKLGDMESGFLQMAYATRSLALDFLGQKSEAQKSLQLAMGCASARVMPSLVLEHSLRFESGEEKVRSILKAFKMADEAKCPISENSFDKERLSSEDCSAAVFDVFSYHHGSDSAIDGFLEYASNESIGHEVSPAEVLGMAAFRSLSSTVSEYAGPLFRSAALLENVKRGDGHRLLVALAIIMGGVANSSLVALRDLFAPYLREGRGKFDGRVIFVLVDSMLRGENREDARKLVAEAAEGAGLDLEGEVPSEDLDALLIFALDAVCRNPGELVLQHVQIIKRMNEAIGVGAFGQSMLFPPNFRDEFGQLLVRSAPFLAPSSGRFGRNEVVTVKRSDGTQIRSKYKYIEGEVKRGLSYVVR